MISSSLENKSESVIIKLQIIIVLKQRFILPMYLFPSKPNSNNTQT